MEEIFKEDMPRVDEETVMYRNPLGEKRGKNRILSGVGMLVIAGLLVAAGVIYILQDNLPLGIVLLACSAVYVAICVMHIVGGVGLMKRPYAVIIDGKNLIVREKNGYLHLPLSVMRRLTVDCYGIEAQLVVLGDGKYDVLIKNDTLYYTVKGVQNSVFSKNMRKIAFVLNGIALGAEKDVNWGERFDELLSSAHVEAEGLSAGLNKELDKMSTLKEERD